MTYEIGVTYIWQNQVGEMEYLNGTECTVVSVPTVYWCVIARAKVQGQKVDTPCKPGYWYFASPGDLRRKPSLPTGLTTVLGWFAAPAPREVETAVCGLEVIASQLQSSIDRCGGELSGCSLCNQLQVFVKNPKNVTVRNAVHCDKDTTGDDRFGYSITSLESEGDMLVVARDMFVGDLVFHSAAMFCCNKGIVA